MRAAYRIAGAMRRALAPGGLNIRHNTGARADQDVFHAHLHVIPRYNSDSVQPGCVWGSLSWVEPRARPSGRGSPM
jgi:histidine triad (HIT) family protein